jgi:predicted metalloprotease
MGGVAAGAGGVGLVGVIVVLLLNLLGGGGGFDIGVPLDDVSAGVGGPKNPPPRNEFVEFVFDDVQRTWDGMFTEGGSRYDPAALVVFTHSVQTSGCGAATSAVGPFYCPADAHVYLDQEFFDELASRFGAPGDFAQAYVIAHEVGHHVQNLTGTSDDVRRLQQDDPDSANELSIRLELQADCYGGVWGASAGERGLLQSGDLEEGLDAAAAVGDDRIQEAATGRIDQDTWTHGSAEQRTHWFRRGFESGDPGSCDTFSVDEV